METMIQAWLSVWLYVMIAIGITLGVMLRMEEKSGKMLKISHHNEKTCCVWEERGEKQEKIKMHKIF